MQTIIIKILDPLSVEIGYAYCDQKIIHAKNAQH